LTVVSQNQLAFSQE